jgi:magnesium chelatase subunit D
VILAVDASGSMGAERRMEAAKGAVLGLLIDAYQRRDRVALVTFRGDDADVVLRPTGSVEVARARLAELATGGRTPLAAGIQAALGVARGAGGGHRPLLVLITDGRATSAPAGADPVEAARTAAAAVRRSGVPAVVVDVEDGPTRLGLGGDLAAAMSARHLGVAELTAASVLSAVRAAVTG